MRQPSREAQLSAPGASRLSHHSKRAAGVTITSPRFLRMAAMVFAASLSGLVTIHAGGEAGVLPQRPFTAASPVTTPSIIGAHPRPAHTAVTPDVTPRFWGR